MTGSIGAGATYSRASAATYYNSSGILVSATTNTPRFDYNPTTLALRGLYLEETSTNMLAPSIPSTAANWGVSGACALGGTNLAPDGTSTAPLLSATDTTTGVRQVSYIPGVNATASTSYTISAFLKKSAASNAHFQINTGSVSAAATAYFDLTNGGAFIGADLIPGFTAPVVTITPHPNGWYRCSLTITTPSPTTSIILFIGPSNVASSSGDNRNSTGVVGQGIYVWGAQIEPLPYVSSHIVTTTVAVTRAADSLRYPIASVTGFDATKGSLAHEYIMEGIPLSYGSAVAFIGANPVNDYLLVDQYVAASPTPNTGWNNIATGGVTTGRATFGNTPIPYNAIIRAAGSWILGNPMRGSHNEQVAVPLDGNTTAIPVVTLLALTDTVSGQPKLSQWARRTLYWPRQLAQAELNGATTPDGPTLSLDFMTPGLLDPRITFARASTATYTDSAGVIQTAAVNGPRWDYDPVSHALRGVLIEESRMNALNTSSSDFTDPGWTKRFCTATRSGTAPDGTSFNLITEDTTTADHCWFGGNYTTSAAGVYTASIYVRAGTRRYISLRGDVVTGLNFPWITFDFQTQTINANPLVTSSGFQDVGGGTYRLWLTWTALGGLAQVLIAMSDIATAPASGNNVGNSYTGTSQTVFAWGTQVEQGSFPTTLIPTTTVAVSRASEFASMPTNVSWYNGRSGTIMTNNMLPPNGNNGTRGLFTLDGGVSNFWLRLFSQAGSASIVGSADGAVFGASTMTPGTPFKVAASYSSTRIGIAMNGVGNAPGGFGLATSAGYTTLRLGLGDIAAFNFANGYLRQLLYWNRVLSDSEMVQVTT